jgi:hypothetical protein
VNHRRRREEDEERQHIETHTSVHEWEVKERKRELLPHPFSKSTHGLLMDISLMNFYHEGTSLRGNSLLLQKLIRHWDHAKHGFRVGPDLWYHPTKEDVHFIIGLSRRGSIFPISLCYCLVL